MEKTCVVVGSINVDFFIGVEALPKPNETLMGQSLTTALGGKGLNQAVACARSGLRTHMVAATGDDTLGQQARDFLVERGVEISCLVSVKKVATGVANIVVARGGDNMIVVSPGANACLAPEQVDAAEDLISKADVLVVQLETPMPTVQRALEIARRHAVMTVLNPAPVDVRARSLFPLVDLITPNETELMKLTGITELDDDNLIAGLQALIDLGASRAVVTLGDKGSATLLDGKLMRVPPFQVLAVDATGAGDVFNGALVTRLVHGDDLLKAMHYASAASAISVTKPSADSAPSEEDVRNFLASH